MKKNTGENPIDKIVNVTGMGGGVNLSERMIYLHPEFSLISLADFILATKFIINSSGDAESPITLYISCYGGDFLAAQGLIDYIKIQSYKVNTFGVGPIMSAATVILAGGTGERTLTQNSILMVHSISASFGGNALDISNEAVQVKASQNRLYGLLEANSNQPASFWKKKATSNFYITPDQAKSFGLIDRIIEPIHK